MSKVYKVVLLIQLVVVLFAVKSYSQADTLLVKNLTSEWYYSDGDRLLPLVRLQDFQGVAIYFSIDPKNFSGSSLLIDPQQPISLYINNRLYQRFSSIRIFPLEELSHFDEELQVVLYAEHLIPDQITTGLVNIADKPANTYQEQRIQIRPSSYMEDLYLTALLLILVLGAMLYFFYPRMFLDFIKVSRAVSARDSEENLFKSRPLARANLLFYIFFSLLVALCLLMVISLGDLYFGGVLFRPVSYIDGLWKWLKISSVVFAWVIIKYILINSFTSLYRCGGFLNSHFLNYIRLNLLLCMMGLITVFVAYYSAGILEPNFYKTLFHSLIVLSVITIAIIYIKLMNSVGFKNLHLFSYLCGTEIIPFVLILGIGTN